MAIITTFTGSEWHSSNGAKGYVFILESLQEIQEDKKEVFIQDSKIAVLQDIQYFNVQGGNHGKWQEAIYEIPNGTMIKLFSISTNRGVRDGGGNAYFIIDETQPSRKAEGEGYHENIGYVKGSLLHIPFEKLAEHNIVIPAKMKQYYRDGLITIEEVPPTEE